MRSSRSSHHQIRWTNQPENSNYSWEFVLYYNKEIFFYCLVKWFSNGCTFEKPAKIKIEIDSKINIFSQIFFCFFNWSFIMLVAHCFSCSDSLIRTIKIIFYREVLSCVECMHFLHEDTYFIRISSPSALEIHLLQDTNFFKVSRSLLN